MLEDDVLLELNQCQDKSILSSSLKICEKYGEENVRDIILKLGFEKKIKIKLTPQNNDKRFPILILL